MQQQVWVMTFAAPALEALYRAGGQLGAAFEVDVAQANNDMRHGPLPTS